MSAGRGAILALTLAAATSAACSGGLGDTAWLGSSQPRRGVGLGPMRLLWTQRLTIEQEGPFVPVERALAGLDPSRDRVYVGSTAGKLYAMRVNGGREWVYDARGAIESRPVVDSARDELYFGTEAGTLHALRASDGSVRYRVRTRGPVREAPLLLPDAVYIVTDTDVVVAHSRSDGAVLWAYERAAPEGYSVAQRAGLVLAHGKLVTGFTDGTVVALEPVEGTLVWDRDTSVDVEMGPGARTQLVDVDTTPVLVGDDLYVASFAGGLYALDARSGSVRFRDASRTGVVGLAREGDRLIVSSADDGVVCLLLDDARTELWRRPIERGAPGEPVVAGRSVLVPVSDGPFLSLSLETGEELGRFESGHGFTAPASVYDGIGFVMSNGGSLFAFAY